MHTTVGLLVCFQNKVVSPELLYSLLGLDAKDENQILMGPQNEQSLM